MKTLQFKCTLLTDVILNVKSATEGNNKTLDFIPGNNFLGIAAKELYKPSLLDPNVLLTLFHSGKVRFGDAHLAYDDRIRSLKIPASMFYPKLKRVSEKCYIHHYYDRDMDHEDNGFSQQLKQCRLGFYAFIDNKGKPVSAEKSFAIKSAYDRAMRRSKDKALFGYESLDKDAKMFFEVEIDDDSVSDEIVDKLKTALIGEKRIGRSRTAQFGLVRIEESVFTESQSKKKSGDFVTIYADGRLIFLDKYGLPAFQPTEKQLGIDDPNATILWCKSQIRTFQYTPWNFKRQAHDTDRCGIEKGSVFVVSCSSSPEQSQYVGSYQNEGFGKVIYNPDFLEIADDAKNGESKYIIEEKENDKLPNNDTIPLGGTPLLNYIKEQKRKSDVEKTIYTIVNKYVENWSTYALDDFASQWGTIRKIAMQYNTKEDLKRELFEKKVQVGKREGGKEVDAAYLTHGIAKDKWEKGGRLNLLKDFFEEKELTDDSIQLALINLASEMAKKCRKEAHNG